MKWLHKFDVNKIVRNGDGENFKEIAKKVYNELKPHECFEQFNLELLLSVDDVEEFDSIWEELYDYCDRNRIWLGL